MVLTESIQIIEAIKNLIVKIIHLLTKNEETFKLALDIIKGLESFVEIIAEKPEVLNSLLLLIKQIIELTLTVSG